MVLLYLFFKRSFCLLKADVEIFIVEMIYCLRFASKESRIVGREMYGGL